MSFSASIVSLNNGISNITPRVYVNSEMDNVDQTLPENTRFLTKSSRAFMHMAANNYDVRGKEVSLEILSKIETQVVLLSPIAIAMLMKGTTLNPSFNLSNIAILQAKLLSAFGLGLVAGHGSLVILESMLYRMHNTIENMAEAITPLFGKYESQVNSAISRLRCFDYIAAIAVPIFIGKKVGEALIDGNPTGLALGANLVLLFKTFAAIRAIDTATHYFAKTKADFNQVA